MSLLQARLGVGAVAALRSGLLPLCEIVSVSSSLLDRGLAALAASGSRAISLTDWTSFEIMRERGMSRDLAFDAHFRRQGFELVG